MFEDFMEQAKEVAVNEIDVILYRIDKLMDGLCELVSAFAKTTTSLERGSENE